MQSKTKLYFKILLFVFSFLFLNLGIINAQPDKKINIKNYENKVILNVGKTDITFGEVRNAYNKSSMKNSTSSFEFIPKNEAIDFLDAYSQYKMKILDGRQRGYDKDAEVVSEIAKNKKILAESYLLDNDVIEPNIRKYTDMRKIEKQIAVIMVNYNPNGDTLEAYNKIMAALKEIKNGETFEYVAKKYSSDTTSANNGGIVTTYVTGMRLQREIENVIYKLKVGEITDKPIKTGYGYFLIKLIKEQPRNFIGISHILIPFSNDIADAGPIIADTAQALKLADSLYQAINTGADFNEIAKTFSSDKANSFKGGNLGVYARSTGIVGRGENLNAIIEDTAFALKDKQISKPVKTKYGVHIVRRDSSVIQPEDFEYNDLKVNYNRLFFQKDKQSFYDSLAVALCKFSINEPTFSTLLNSIDTTKTVFDTSFVSSIPKNLYSQTLYTINNTNHTLEGFVNELTTNPNYKIAAANRTGLTEVIKKIIEPSIIDAAIVNIDKTHPKFNTVVDDFSEGIILFKAEEINIWNKVIFDTVRARKFYDTTKMELKKPLEYDISEIYVLTKDKANEIYDELKSGKITFDSAATQYTQRPAFRDKQGRFGFVNTSNKLAATAKEKNMNIGDYSEPFKFETGYSIIKVNEISPERRETFEEALPHISATVQDELIQQLRNDWMARLKKEYKVKFNEKLLTEIYGK